MHTHFQEARQSSLHSELQVTKGLGNLPAGKDHIDWASSRMDRAKSQSMDGATYEKGRMSKSKPCDLKENFSMYSSQPLCGLFTFIHHLRLKVYVSW
jgi:hypothetical protein